MSAGDNVLSDGHHSDRNTVLLRRVLPLEVANTETSVLETVLEYGTAKAASIGQFAAGKTGTTSNYGDAWFVGWDSKYTVAVWVGYPNSLVPMTTDYDGGPVLGGTFPALIWHGFMTSAIQVEKERASEAAAAKSAKAGSSGSSGSTTGTNSQSETSGSTIETTATPPPAATSPKSGAGEAAKSAPAVTPATGGGERGEATGQAPKSEATPAAPTPAPATPPATPSPETPANEAPASKAGGTGATGGVSPSG